MTFSTDRDLPAVEPNVFTDVPFCGQQRVKVCDAAVSATTLTSAGADFSMVAAGSVALVEGVVHEVIERVDDNTLTVSLLRADPSQAALAGVQGNNLDVKVRTFSHQAKVVHAQLLGMLGLDIDDPQQADAQAIVSLQVMKQLEVLGVLECIYLGAMGISGDNEQLAAKAEMYRRRFNTACRQATVLLDLDGDGQVDTQRQPGIGRMVRV